MSEKKGYVIFIPSGNADSAEIWETVLHRKLSAEGYVTSILSVPQKSKGKVALPSEITDTVNGNPGEQTVLVGVTVSARIVLDIMIDDPSRISAGILISPDFYEELKYRLSRIELPLLICNGANDSEKYLKAGRKYHDLIEGSSLSVLRKSGHLPHRDNPERFFLTLKKFLDDEL